MFGRVEQNDITIRVGLSRNRRNRYALYAPRRERTRSDERAEIREVAEDTVAVVHPVSAADGQAFLVGLPTAPALDELIGNGFADGIRGGRDGFKPIDVPQAGRPFVRAVDSGRRSIGPGACDRAN